MSRANDDLVFVQWFTNKISALLNFIVHFVLITGLISNFLNIIVSSRKRILGSTVGFYYIFISIFNIFSLITGWLRFNQSIGFANLILISGKWMILKILPIEKKIIKIRFRTSKKKKLFVNFKSINY